MPFPIGGFGTKPLSVTVSEIFNVECNAMVDMTLIRPLNKGQGHSFSYQSISHIRLPLFIYDIYVAAVNSNFCSRTHRLATIHSVHTDDDDDDDDDIRTQYCRQRDRTYCRQKNKLAR